MHPSSIVEYYKEWTVALSLKTRVFPQMNYLAPTEVFGGMLFPTPFLPVETVQSFSLVAGSVSLGGMIPPGSATDPSVRVVVCFFGRLRE